jgi:hypothetical protein
MKYSINLPKISFKELMENHEKISLNYNLEFKKKYFEEYLRS